MEGLLLDALQEANAKSSAAGRFKGKDLVEWDLGALIDVAVSLGIISGSTQKLSAAVKDFRNLVHPGKEIREKLTFDVHEANIAEEVLEIVIRDLKAKAYTGRPGPKNQAPSESAQKSDD